LPHSLVCRTEFCESLSERTGFFSCRFSAWEVCYRFLRDFFFWSYSATILSP